MSKRKTKTVYRDSVTGEFITQNEAERRPRETEKERIRIQPTKKKKK
ncbi:MAG: multidrug transporter [candidate division Zixibacteria bacterium]